MVGGLIHAAVGSFCACGMRCLKRFGVRWQAPASVACRCLRTSAARPVAAWKDRKELAAALNPVHQAANADLAAAALDEFETGQWGKKFPTVAAL